MKELSIEEKAKAYDEAIKRAKNTIEVNQTIPDIVECVESLFPELKQSEDERIRKELIKQVVYIVPNDDEIDNEGNVLPIYQQRIDKYVAWLEKQGEQPKKHNICDTCVEKDGCIEPCCIKLVEKQGEQKPADKVEPKFKVGQTIIYKGTENIAPTKMTISDIAKEQYLDDNCCIVPISDQDNWELVEQKPIDPDTFIQQRVDALADIVAEQEPAEWSEEDEKMFEYALNMIEWYSVVDKDKSIHVSDWFKSLKDRVQPKQEWNEEDDEQLSNAIFFVREYQIPTRDKKLLEAAKKAEEWLESLRPQSTWKPSDEQIKMLENQNNTAC